MPFNIVIKGVRVYHCGNCGEEYIQYGNIDKIDQAIAKALLGKENTLTGKEIRFLRTWKGYSGKGHVLSMAKLADRLMKTPEGAGNMLDNSAFLLVSEGGTGVGQEGSNVAHGAVNMATVLIGKEGQCPYSNEQGTPK